MNNLLNKIKTSIKNLFIGWGMYNCSKCDEPYDLMGYSSIVCSKCGHRNY